MLAALAFDGLRLAGPASAGPAAGGAPCPLAGLAPPLGSAGADMDVNEGFGDRKEFVGGEAPNGPVEFGLPVCASAA